MNRSTILLNINRARLFLTVLAAALILCFAGIAAAQETLLRLQSENRALFNRVKASVVAISAEPLEKIETGDPSAREGQPGAGNSTDAAFAVRDGYLLTSAETVLAFAATSRDPDPRVRLASVKNIYVITAAGDSHKCSVVGSDMATLLTVLKLPEGVTLPPLALAKAAPPVGATVAAVANSYDSIITDGTASFATGTLSDRYRMEPDDVLHDPKEPGDPYRGTCVEFEGAGNPGDNGAPIVDTAGNVVAMICAHYHGGRHLPVAVPVDQFRLSFDAIAAGKPTPQPWLGVTFANGNADFTGDPTVTRIAEKGPAERAGLRVGDVIVGVDNMPVTTRLELDRYLGVPFEMGTRGITTGNGDVVEVRTAVSYGMPAATTLLLTVRRDGALRNISLTAGVRGEPLEPVAAPVEPDTAASALAQAARKRAAALGNHVVQVVVEWDRLNEPAGETPTAGLEGDLQGLFGGEADRDTTFFDLKLGPYTGVVVGADGQILISDSMLGAWEAPQGRDGEAYEPTAIHVVLADGRMFAAKVTGRNQEADLALLKIDATGLSPIQFADADFNPGSTVEILSRSNDCFVLGQRAGIVSAVSRDNDSRFQFDARVGSCDLGGLVMHSSGRAVGIVTALNLQMVGKSSGVALAAYASAINKALPLLRDGRFTPKPARGFLGISAAPISLDEPGLKVSDVTEDQAAARAGIAEGDILLELDGQPLRRTADLAKSVMGKAPGTKVKLKYRRGETEETVTVTLGKRPD